MSWSIEVTGEPEKVAKYLEAYESRLSGQSQDEYKEALPHLLGLVGQNIPTSNYPFVIKVTASGSAVFTNGQKTSSDCSVKIENLGSLCT